METDERYQALYKIVQRVFADQVRTSTDRVSLDLNIIDTFKADSIDVLQIVMRIEELFEIDISDEDAKGFVTVRYATEYLYNTGATG